MGQGFGFQPLHAEYLRGPSRLQLGSVSSGLKWVLLSFLRCASWIHDWSDICLRLLQAVLSPSD